MLAQIAQARDRLRGRDRSALLAVFVLVALVLRIAVVVATPHFVPMTDAREYDEAAVTLVQHGAFPESVATFHGGPSAYHPPLFSVMLAGVDEIVGTGSEHLRWDAGRVLEALLGALTVWLVAQIAQRIWRSSRVSLTAAAITAIYPPLILAGSSLLSESLFIPLSLAAVWLALIHRDDPRLRWAVGAGALLGLASLTRGNGFLLVIPVAFLLGRPALSWAALRAPLAVLATMIVVLIPWTIRNEHVFHTFVPVTTETGYALAGTYNSTVQRQALNPALWTAPFRAVAAVLRADPTANEAQISSRLQTVSIHYIRAHPGSLLKTVYWNTVRMLGFSPGVERLLAPFEAYPKRLAVVSNYAIWVLLILAGIGAPQAITRRAPRALWLCPLLVYLSAVVLEGTLRYRVPADPFLILPAAIGALAVFDHVTARRRRASAVGAPA